jgi:c-di-GMP-binding flagellar brake protein YcgR
MQPSEFLVEPIDILAHLFFASGTSDRVVVTTPAGVFAGAFLYPDGDGALLACPPSVPAFSHGASVTVEYAGPTDQYRFQSTILAREAGGIRVDLPTSIERHDQRITARFPVSPDAGIRFVQTRDGHEVTWPVLDISDGGVSLVDANGRPMSVGDRISGQLHVPDVEPFDAVLEVRHIRNQDDSRHVGARFAEMSLESRGELARLLLLWLRAHAVAAK